MADLVALAKAISASSSRIKAYAIAQATAHVALEARVARLEASTPGAGKAVYVPVGASIQQAVDAAEDGTLLTLGAGVHDLTDEIVISPKSALRFQGEGGVGFNEGGRWGTVLRQHTAGKAVFRDDGFGASVKHAGPKFEWLNLHAVAPNVTGFMLRQTNHVTIRECSLQGTFRAPIDADVPISEYPMGDDAYGLIEHVTISNTQPDQVGMLLGDGFWWIHATNFNLDGLNPTGIRNLRGVVNVMQTKFNHAGCHIYCSGASSVIVGNDFEIAPVSDVYTLQFERGSSPLHGAGCYHKVNSNNFTPHLTAGKALRAVKFGAGTYGGKFRDNTYYGNDSLSFVDLGDNEVWP